MARRHGKLKFELGAIAWHCKEVYLEDPGYYDDYIPISMLGASNDFYNFCNAPQSLLVASVGPARKSSFPSYGV